MLEVYREVALWELAPLKDLILMHFLPEVPSHNVLTECHVLKYLIITFPQFLILLFYTLIVAEMLL